MYDHVYYVYIISSRPHGAIYIGVTNDLVKRTLEHRAGEGSKHARKYKIDRLVYFEVFDQIGDAIDREKKLKRWRRAWKDALIRERNPSWRDLFEDIQGGL